MQCHVTLIAYIARIARVASDASDESDESDVMRQRRFYIRLARLPLDRSFVLNLVYHLYHLCDNMNLGLQRKEIKSRFENSKLQKEESARDTSLYTVAGSKGCPKRAPCFECQACHILRQDRGFCHRRGASIYCNGGRRLNGSPPRVVCTPRAN